MTKHGDINMIETKIYNRGQTTIPSEFRKEYNLTNDDIVEWNKMKKEKS